MDGKSQDAYCRASDVKERAEIRTRKVKGCVDGQTEGVGAAPSTPSLCTTALPMLTVPECVRGRLSKALLVVALCKNADIQISSLLF